MCDWSQTVVFTNGVVDNCRIAQAASGVMGARSYLGREDFPIGVGWAGRMGPVRGAYGEAAVIIHRLAGTIDEEDLRVGFITTVCVQSILQLSTF